jgi:hypothetical protein
VPGQEFSEEVQVRLTHLGIISVDLALRTMRLDGSTKRVKASRNETSE